MKKIAQYILVLVYDLFEENDVGSPISFAIMIAVSIAMARRFL